MLQGQVCCTQILCYFHSIKEAAQNRPVAFQLISSKPFPSNQPQAHRVAPLLAATKYLHWWVPSIQWGLGQAHSSQVALPGVQKELWSRASWEEGRERHEGSMEERAGVHPGCKRGRRNEKKPTFVECPLCVRPFTCLIPLNPYCIAQPVSSIYNESSSVH